jgi:RNA polymerase sigma-70 factor, ECF subfamily
MIAIFRDRLHAIVTMPGAQGEVRSGGDEARIMDAARTDLTLFAPLYEQYAPRIYAYCLRRVSSREEAEDLTSLIFTHALNGMSDYRGGSVAAWLFRIAHNTVVSHYRSRKPQMSLALAEGEVDSHDLVEIIMQSETQRDIRAFVAALPDAQQELIALRISGGLTAEEAGKVLGKSAGAVRVEYHRIIKRLRVWFQQGER